MNFTPAEDLLLRGCVSGGERMINGNMGNKDDLSDIERRKQMSVQAVERTYHEFMKEKEYVILSE